MVQCWCISIFLFILLNVYIYIHIYIYMAKGLRNTTKRLQAALMDLKTLLYVVTFLGDCVWRFINKGFEFEVLCWDTFFLISVSLQIDIDVLYWLLVHHMRLPEHTSVWLHNHLKSFIIKIWALLWINCCVSRVNVNMYAHAQMLT